MVLLTAVRNAAKRVPSIRFRAGQPQAASASHGSQSASSGSSQVSSNAQPVRQGHAIESYQLPPRYKRLPIDEAEIEMINSGFWHK
ncbi:uncharacterized protein LOC134838554 isoform X1 [Culicoides brevitarsis]|uniref:uncharacterized protein LOC134838554 isoform X1 n=1 Tax=Culicoides brevitarsis TaxID=469753 RepID=UPI00307C8DF2